MTDQLPEAFIQRIGEQLGDELPFFLEAMKSPPFRGIRSNPFREGHENPFRDAGERIPWAAEAWELPEDSAAGITVAHEAGAFYLQDPSAMLPAAVLAAKPGERILDLCAAPGGKSTQIGADLRGKGLLISNEPVPQRAAILSRNLERMGIPNAVVTCAFPEQLASAWPEGFDAVIADAPCSGEGMFRKQPETRREWSPEKASGCAARQRGILDSAAKCVRAGGRLVYSTCTWNPAENEEQVRGFLEEHPEFEPEEFRLPGAVSANGTFTCWPHRVRGEGQFTALLRKKGNAASRLPDGSRAFRFSPEDFRVWRDSGIKTEEPTALFGGTLVHLEEIPELRSIRVLRLGLHLGTVRGNIFQPDHAAAVGMKRPGMPVMEMDGADTLKYLSGETIAGDLRGWTLMARNGLVLGWAKGSGGQMKNHYPKGLRNGKLTE